MEDKINRMLEKQPQHWKTQLAVLIGIIALLGWSGSAIEFRGISARGPAMALGILNGLIHPDTEILFSLTVDGVPYLILETLAIAFLGTIIGTIIAAPLAFLTARNVTPKPVHYTMLVVVMLIRTFPSFIYGLMFIRITGPGAFAGVLTMSLSSVGMLTKRNAEVVEDIDRGVLESLGAAGCTGFQKIRYGILPQLYSNFVSNMIYRFDINMKNASVLGLVGAGGIGAPLIFNMNSYRWNAVGSLLIGLVVMVLLFEYISTRIRIKLARGF